MEGARERRKGEAESTLPDGTSGACIITAIIKLSFLMIPWVVMTVMQRGVRQGSSGFKAIKISCRCVGEQHSTNSLAHREDLRLCSPTTRDH